MSNHGITYLSYTLQEHHLSLNVVYENQQKDSKPILSIGHEDLDTFLKRSVNTIYQSTLQYLDMESLPSDLLIGLDMSNAQRDAFRNAFSQVGIESHRLLNMPAVYASVHFDEYQKTLLKMVQHWSQETNVNPALFTRISAEVRDQHKLELNSQVFKKLESNLQKQIMKVAIVGAMKAGKSTFLNAVLGKFVMPAMDKRCTRRRFVLRNADESGNEVRSVEVWLSKENRSYKEPTLSLSADENGWTTEELRGYLFALNSPNLLDHSELTPIETQLLDDFKSLSFGQKSQDQVQKALKTSSKYIDKIVLTHPFYKLKAKETGKIEFWDTPGPNAIEEFEKEASENSIRGLSDRQTFNNAIKEADALVVIFNVMQQESEAQDEIFKAVKLYQGKSGSVLLVANKVDLRQKRATISLDDLLANLQKEGEKRYGLKLRKPIPNSSRPAQISREIAQAVQSVGGEIDDLEDHPIYGDLYEEYEPFETKKVRKLAKNLGFEDFPWIGVEEVSGIKKTEKALREFFKQEKGRAVLSGVVRHIYPFLTCNQGYCEIELNALKTKIEDLYKLQDTLNQETQGFETLQRHHLDVFHTHQSSQLNQLYAQIDRISQERKRGFSTFLDRLFPGEDHKIDDLHFQERAGEVKSQFNSQIYSYNESVQEIMDKVTQDQILTSLGQEQDQFIGEIRNKIKRDLKIKTSHPVINKEISHQGARKSKTLTPKFKTEHRYDQVELEDAGNLAGGLVGGAGAAAGAIVAGAKVAAVVASGPIGWFAIAGVGLAGLAGGGIAGWLAGDQVGKAGYKATHAKKEVKVLSHKKLKSSLLKTLKEELESTNQKNKNAIKAYYNALFQAIQKSGQQNLNQLNEQLKKIKKEAEDPNKQLYVEQLESENQSYWNDLKPLEEIAKKLELLKDR